jgi:hypothetical protein
MKTTVETQSGSIYELDNVKMTWRRSFENTGLSGVLRSDGGEMSSFPAIKLDKPMVIQCPPIVSHAIGRAIVTTPVVQISHEATGFANGAPNSSGRTTYGFMAGLAAGGKRAVDQAGRGCAARNARIRASCNGEPATTDEAKAAANVVKDCTRPLPHVCKQNGPCNGWPRPDRFNVDAIMRNGEEYCPDSHGGKYDGCSTSAIGSNRTPRVTSEQADGCDHPKSVGCDGWICVRFYRP